MGQNKSKQIQMGQYKANGSNTSGFGQNGWLNGSLQLYLGQNGLIDSKVSKWVKTTQNGSKQV